MNADRLDIDALQKGLRAEGFSCGPLWPAGTSGKRQVWTDGVVVIRVSTAKTVLSNSVEDELNWARRIGDVVPAQRPIAGPFYLAGSTATVWEWLDGMPAAPEHAAAHGTLLRTLHDQGGRQIHGPAIADQLESARARLPLVRN